MLKFIHAADLHLDSPLRGLGCYDGAPVEEIRNAGRRALDNLVQLAIDYSHCTGGTLLTSCSPRGILRMSFLAFFDASPRYGRRVEPMSTTLAPGTVADAYDPLGLIAL
jgi:hypothetical protein